MRGVVIGGTHSGCGKTTVILGILAALKKRNYAVQPFKAGPDFIDTGLHKLVTGRTSRNLDLWMCGGEYVSACFDRYSRDADISVVEGVMGLYDGSCSTAALAAALDLPVVLVIDAYGMAESAGALVKGFMEYREEALKSGSAEAKDFRSSGLPRFSTHLAGVIFNRVASERHYRRLKNAVYDVPVLGYLPRNLEFNIPHRHLGLVVAEEEPIDEGEIDKLADAVLEYIDMDALVRKSGRAEARKDPSALPIFSSSGLKIGVAYDRAFCFYYQDNLDLLRAEGAAIELFSPLSDSKIPGGIDALYIGGGYPELYAGQLAANHSMRGSIRSFAENGMPVYAECGGFMYLTEGIYDLQDTYYPMSGIYPFRTRMRQGRVRLGYREAVLREDSVLGGKGDTVRGHEFHYSEIAENGEAASRSARMERIYSVKDAAGGAQADEGYRIKNTLGSYIHIHFGSSPYIAGRFTEFVRSAAAHYQGHKGALWKR